MVDDTGPDLITALLVAKYLIRKGGKEAVAYSGEKQLAKITTGKEVLHEIDWTRSGKYRPSPTIFAAYKPRL